MSIDLDTLHLAKGGHGRRDQGVCLMEAVAWWRDIGHTDAPACVSPILRNAGITLNDVLPDDTRQQLIPLIPSLPGTAGDGKDEQRGYLALDWLIRTYLPAWLDRVPSLADHALAVRQLDSIHDLTTAELAGSVVRAAREAVRAAAGAAAREAVRAAARDAARDAAGDAAWAAAWAAAGDAAWDAAGDAAWDAVWDAAGAAAWDAARDAAGDAVRDALASTVATLQASAIDLYARMVNR